MEGTGTRPDDSVIALGYGSGELRLDLREAPGARVLLPRRAEGAPDAGEMLRRSLDRPTGSPGLRSIAAGRRSVTIAIPDRTRPAVARDVLPGVLEELAGAGVPASGTGIFVSTGVHAGHSADEMRALVGDDVFEAFEVRQNDGYNPAAFEVLGVTARGTPVEIDRRVAGSDLIVIVGGIAFHYFAGFTGGRKMVVPGAASARTVEHNHRLTLLESGEMHPGCRSGALRGNPVHEDMLEAARLLPGEVYLISVIKDGWGRTAAITSGDLAASHEEGTELVRRLNECRLEERCDIAVAGAGGHPLDLNLIQAHKSLEHAAASVRDGGVLIGVVACSDGVGSGTFLKWFGLKDSRAVARELRSRYELNGHTALSFMKKRERINIILVTELSAKVVGALGVRRAPGIMEALETARGIVGEAPRVYVFPRAWALLPVVEK